MKKVLSINPTLLIAGIVAILLLVSVLFPMQALAAPDANSAACEAIGGSVGSGGNCNVSGGNGPTLMGTIANVVNILSVIVGVAAVLMIIIGGFRFVTSGGDANGTKSARDTIIYALVGLVIVAFAQAIVHFILGRTTV